MRGEDFPFSHLLVHPGALPVRWSWLAQRLGISLFSISMPLPISGTTSIRHGGILHVQSLDFWVSSGRSHVQFWCQSSHTVAWIAESRLCGVCLGDWGVNSLCIPTKSGPHQQCDLSSVILKFLKYCDEVHTT